MIDIIIPAYNAQKTIKKTLASIAMQSIKDIIKVTIVNDCSKKDYSEIIEMFKSIINITEIKMDKNSGPGVCRQKGIDNTTNPYIMFVDADDLLYDCYSVERLYRAMKNNNYVVGTMMDEDKGKYSYWKNHTGCLHAKMYRRKHLEKEKIRFNNTRQSEDYSFHSLNILSTKKEKVIEHIVYLYKDNKNSITNDKLYKIESINSHIYNVLWTVSQAEKRKYSPEKIADLIYNALIYLYFIYAKNYKNKQFNKLLVWIKPLIEVYERYESILTNKEKIDIYRIYGSENDVIPDITLSDFIDRAENI